jgi:thiol-disulfide isomerase/thioredoxin
MTARGETAHDILEAVGVETLDEEALRDWPPKPEKEEEEEGEGKDEGKGDREVDRKGEGAGGTEQLPKAAVVFFTAPWCEVSLEAAPRFVKVARDFAGRADFRQVDADRAPVGAERLNVRSVPAVVAFARGNEISRRVGLAGEDVLRRLVSEAIKEAEIDGTTPDGKAAPEGNGT